MTPAERAAEARLKEAIEFQSQGGVFGQALEDAINRRLNFNRDLLEEREAATEEFIGLGPQARAELAQGPILNPLDREAAIAGRRQNVGTRLGGVLSRLQARQQNIGDILGRAETSFAAEAQRRMGLAQLAQRQAEAAAARRRQQQLIDAANRRFEQEQAGDQDEGFGDKRTADFTGMTITPSGFTDVVGGRGLGAIEEAGRGLEETGVGGALVGGLKAAFRPTKGQNILQRITQNFGLLNQGGNEIERSIFQSAKRGISNLFD